MLLEQQLARLAEFGLTLNEGVTVDDLLYSFDRQNYEDEPFDLILFVFGIEVEREPWGRNVCSSVWNFDTECISMTGDYVAIVKRLCEVASKIDLISDVEDFIDWRAGTAWLKYKIDGIDREWTVEINDDWADISTISSVMDDIERDGYRFYSKDNGQAMILFYLHEDTANTINQLSNNSLTIST